MLNYGLVGLGNLGEKIARNLLKKKFTVKVCMIKIRKK